MNMKIFFNTPHNYTYKTPG